jgi:hypothetical protein
VTVLLRSDAARMAFLFPPAVRVEAVDFGRLRRPGYRAAVCRRLCRAGYRLVVHTDYLRHPDLDEALVAAARAPETAAMEPRPSARHGRGRAGGRRLYRRLFDSGPVVADKLLRWAAFARFLTGTALPPPLARLPAERMPAPAALARPTAVLQPFSAVAAKQCPPELWRRIIAALPAGWEVRVAGHPADLARNPDYRPLLEIPGVVFEPAPFRELAPILAAAALVVSVDTACMHLAAVLGAPTLCLASAAYVGEIVPYAAAAMPDNLTVVHADCPDRGCLGACTRGLEDGRYPCVAALDPGRVLAEVAAMAARRAA